jgi:uncharacterized RDD family membrane protein YckC
MNEFVYVGFWRRVLATLLDCIVLSPLIVATFYFQKWGMTNKNIIPETSITLFYYLYYVFFVSKFGGTPGKLLSKITIVDINGNYLKWYKTIIRYLPLMTPSILKIFQYLYIFHNIPSNITLVSSIKNYQIITQYSGPFILITGLTSLFCMIDVLNILCNIKKRAIHDFLAGSFVIEKQIEV